MDATAEELLRFWLDEVGPEGWYKVDEALDARFAIAGARSGTSRGPAGWRNGTPRRARAWRW